MESATKGGRFVFCRRFLCS